jgi:hypothetical protein
MSMQEMDDETTTLNTTYASSVFQFSDGTYSWFFCYVDTDVPTEAEDSAEYIMLLRTRYQGTLSDI